ncbi:sigma-70 family RNA polymerase sigma factor [Streptomyces sp. NPDC053048]|uniref:sigma-70 family RNA polymerase sigma factor n=1 Tax=Streptomyces sp. NPDC053048 TaxID=3365694 RepID=UPI0037D7F474
MTGTNVADMVEAAQAGQAEAREELVAACLPLVYNIVGRALNGHADVDDVVQETMIRMVGGLGKLRDPSRFRSWLVAITVNQIRRHWRTERQDAPVTGLQDAGDVHDPDADFVGLTIVRLSLEGQRKQAAEATRWLDDEERAVLSLWWLETTGELTRAEVAAALELSPQHTAVRVQRIKIQLETARAVVRALSTTPRCRELAAVLGLWDGVPSPLWRKRIARHARGCAGCSGHWTALVPAEGLLAGLGLVPVAAELLDRVTRRLPAAPTSCDVPPTTEPDAPGDGPADGPRRALARPVVAAAALAVVAGGVLSGCDYLTSAPEQTAPQDAAAPSRNVPAEVRVLPLATTPEPSSPAPARTDDVAADRSSATGRRAVTPTARTTAPATPPAPATTPARTASPRHTPPPRPREGLEQQVVRLVNAERARAGCCPLSHNAELSAAALRHSADAPGAFGTGRAAGRQRWHLSGVNTLTGRPDAAAVVTVWMNTPGQRKAVLDCSRTEFGVGVGVAVNSGGPRWTQAFATR